MYKDLYAADSSMSTIGSFAPPTLTYGLSANGDDSQLQRWSSLIGITTAIIGNVLISFALNIQRYAHIRLEREAIEKEKSKKSSYGSTTPQENDGDPSAESDEDHVERTTYLQSPYWWAGILLMTIGETGNFLAYGFAPASIVSPLGVVALISNCVIAPIMLKERFRFRDFCGVVVAVGGAVTVVLSAKQKETKLGPHEVWGAITRSAFEIYMLVTVLMIIGLMWASPKLGSRTILIDLGLVGLFGGYTALSTKGVASMLSSTLWRALTTPVTYALVAILVGTALMQVKYLNRALQRFDSTQVIPVQFVMFTLSVIIGSAVLYRDFEKAKAENMGKFVGGCLLTFFGVFLITSGRPKVQDEEEGEEVDETIGLLNHDIDDDESEGRRDISFASSSSLQPDSSAATPSKPWNGSSNDHLEVGKPPLLNHASTPNLMSSSEFLVAPSLTPRSNSQSHFHTHPNNQTHRGPPQSEFSRMMPGPFSSPLSSSLSAVVADTTARMRSLRRPRLGIRTHSGSQRHSDYEASTDSLLGVPSASENEEQRRLMRARSMSSSLASAKHNGSNNQD